MFYAKRLFDVPYHQVKNYPNATMFVTKIAGDWVATSTQQFLDEVMLVSRGLIALNVQKGDRVSVSANNRVEWNIFDIAVQQIGAILVPLYPTSSESDYTFIINNASVKLFVVSNKELFDKVEKIRSNTPSLSSVFTFDEVEGATNWKAIHKEAAKVDESEVIKRMAEVAPEDMVTIIYTSGTTGNPKGVMLSHINLLSNVEACIAPIPASQGSKVLSFLPVCHVYERMLHYLYMYLGCSVYFAESMETIGENIREVKPEVFSAVPRLIEKVFDKIMAKGEDLSGIKRKLFFWAVALAEEYDFMGKSAWYTFKLTIARKLIFKKWQEALGGNVRAIASGSAALQPRLARIFFAAGLPILEGYGLSETSPVVSVNCFVKGIRIGCVGQLIEKVEVKIAEDGEILVKGPNVMMGYFENEEATNEVFDADGWFHTGDIGTFQEDKFLKITDRKKEIFKTSGGKYIVPQAMENKFKESRFIEQIMVVGEGEKFPAAFIVPNFAYIREWAEDKNQDFTGLSNADIAKSKLVNDRIGVEINTYNKDYGNWEQIKKFALLEKEFSIAANELTPTLKLKRKKIMENYQAEYSNMYLN
ncbi:MAG: long-chain fatty acid--CoA ligase [Crocinitomicaceae bacterium]|nr:long-chain fatty acid--CoA ligase [Crocinitomicaceae bacterium]